MTRHWTRMVGTNKPHSDGNEPSARPPGGRNAGSSSHGKALQKTIEGVQMPDDAGE